MKRSQPLYSRAQRSVVPGIKVKTGWQQMTVLFGVQLPLSEYTLRPYLFRSRILYLSLADAQLYSFRLPTSSWCSSHTPETLGMHCLQKIGHGAAHEGHCDHGRCRDPLSPLSDPELSAVAPAIACHAQHCGSTLATPHHMPH